MKPENKATLPEVLAWESGMNHERAAIVKWLRSEADRVAPRAAIGAHIRNIVADAIERTDHLKGGDTE